MRYDFYVKHWRLIGFIVLVLLVVMGTGYSKAEGFTYGYCESPLNVRADMDVDSEWISQYPKKSTFVILENLGDWLKVEDGFVKAEYVYDEVEIYQIGRINGYALIFGEPDFWLGSIGFVEEGSEELFIRKKNGFAELSSGGWVLESFIDFNYVKEPEILETNLTVDDFQSWNMINLPIKYIGILSDRVKGQGVTKSGALYFQGAIPLYDVLDGVAYFPSGRHIYKMPIENFIEFENVGSAYQTLAAYRTVYHSSGSARRYNIEKVSSILDGTVIKSGSTFSYNKVTGPRDESAGYLEAIVIQNGEEVPGYGGGVCQPSSTIYAAILNNEWFKVTARKPHGLEVSYLPIDMDATVSYDYVDLKFQNQYPFDVILNVKSGDGVCLVTITRAE